MACFELYILIFLHQTATALTKICLIKRCISLYSYIKPQHSVINDVSINAVYPYIPTSNRNLAGQGYASEKAVYPYIPTSNRNLGYEVLNKSSAVYPYIPTSNRNHVGAHIECRSAVYPYIPTSNRNLISGNSFVQRGIHYIQEIKNGSVGPYFIAKLLKKFQLYRLSNKFSFLTTFCAFRLSTEIINITILLISN